LVIGQLVNQRADNLVRQNRSPNVTSITKSMATCKVKVKYGEERFSTLLIKDISFANVKESRCKYLSFWKLLES